MARFDITRRYLLKSAACLSLAAPLGRWLQASEMPLPAREEEGAQAEFVIHPKRTGRIVSKTLTGLSYETLQLADPSFFCADNHALVQLFRQLSPQGVLRIGGNTSDYTVWSDYRGSVPLQTTHKGGPQQPFVLKPEALHALAGFLDATGWSLVFGVNLKIGVPAMAKSLAMAVQQAVGDKLLAIQIGNEANNYEADYAGFDAAWTPFHEALRSTGVPIAGPDTGANSDWVIDYAARHAASNVFLSRHYYRDAAPRGSIEDMLGSDPGFYDEVEQVMQVADAQHLPLRLTEANSYYFGGRDGVSNVFASALWGADFMLALAERGVSGINFHGGSLTSVEASLGREASARAGVDPRDAVSSRYSPIAGDRKLGFAPRPLYYGMSLAQQFAGARMLHGALDTGGVNLAAYAAVRDDAVLVAMINKDSTRDATVLLRGVGGWGHGRLTAMTAPSLESRHAVSFDGWGEQGMGHGGDGGGAAGKAVAVASDGSCRIALPKGSAALLRLHRLA